MLAIIGEELGLLGVGFVFSVCVSRLYGLQHWQAGAQSRGIVFGLCCVWSVAVILRPGPDQYWSEYWVAANERLNTAFSELWGASLIVCCYMAAILLRIQYENDNSSSLEQQDSGEW